MEINTEYLDLKINGVEHKLKLICYKEAEEILNKIEKLSNKTDEELAEKEGMALFKLKGDVILKCGLSKDSLEMLQMKHVNDIFNALVGIKND